MNTLQKTAIVNYLKGSSEHPDAEGVYSHLKKTMLHLSLGTVYRNLDILEKERKIKSVVIKDKRRYEGRDLDHNHFICNQCGDLYDVVMKKLTVKVGKIETVTLSGTCNRCEEEKYGS